MQRAGRRGIDDDAGVRHLHKGRVDGQGGGCAWERGVDEGPRLRYGAATEACDRRPQRVVPGVPAALPGVPAAIAIALPAHARAPLAHGGKGQQMQLERDPVRCRRQRSDQDVCARAGGAEENDHPAFECGGRGGRGGRAQAHAASQRRRGVWWPPCWRCHHRASLASLARPLGETAGEACALVRVSVGMSLIRELDELGGDALNRTPGNEQHRGRELAQPGGRPQLIHHLHRRKRVEAHSRQLRLPMQMLGGGGGAR